ncbi:uncharacterized protein SCHCODRAFT_02310751 [Schizophyllum commune H4-8]|uniref:uncharacterized protein n=1 Tax=Schizophyllum commune (strain H4-8 / FGSC 9210) TaxID=578458 RepID=UPI002160771A|nr:uncharacterized protein SCHCODRAFT_02310751 [Schizophyllum commune H4-8]KAI5891109.1 hypothetical protein SCHCODRAFT_02310751 [Schizophyllum commune H4-8]
MGGVFRMGVSVRTSRMYIRLSGTCARRVLVRSSLYIRTITSESACTMLAHPLLLPFGKWRTWTGMQVCP